MPDEEIHNGGSGDDGVANDATYDWDNMPDCAKEYLDFQQRGSNLNAAWAFANNGARHADDLRGKEWLKKNKRDRKGEAMKKSKWLEVPIIAMEMGMKSIQIVLDDCSDENFITQGIALDLGLELTSAARSFTVINGAHFETTHMTTVTFYGKRSQIIREKFYVLGQESPIQHPYVGKAFINKWNEYLHDERPNSEVFYTAMKKCKADEKARIELERAAAEAEAARIAQTRKQISRQPLDQTTGSRSGASNSKRGSESGTQATGSRNKRREN